MILLAIALSGLELQKATPNERLSSISKARQAFEAKFVKDEKFGKRQTLTGNRNLQIYYPIGKGDRRYVVDMDPKGLSLLYQSFKADKARTQWRVSLVRSKTKRFTGTLGLTLGALGVDVKGAPSVAQKDLLNDPTLLAGYQLGGGSGKELAAWVVTKGGSWSPTHYYEGAKTIPIVSDESYALGLGRIDWPETLKFKLRD